MPIQFSRIPEVLDDFCGGKIIVLLDDEDRKIEGGLIYTTVIGFLDK